MFRQVFPSVFLALLLVLLVLGACSSNGGDAPGLDDVSALLSENCAGSGCHVGFAGTAAASLDLSEAALCAAVIDVPSAESTEVLVRPGASQESYLLCKSDADCRRRDPRASLMPLGTAGLGAEQLATLAAWIDGGAQGCTSGAGAPLFGGVTSATGLPSAIRLEWSPASDDVSPATTIEYLIYESETSGGQNFSEPTKVSAPGATTAVVGGLPLSAERFYVVRARDEAGNVDTNTVELAATTSPTADETTPTFAGIATVLAIGSSSLEVTWAAATDDVTPTEDIIYNIYVATSQGGQDFASPTATSEAGVTSALVAGLTSETSYFAVVRAVDGNANEDVNTVELGASTGAPVSFSEDVAPILISNCTNAGCHRAPMNAGELNLSANSAHAELVNVASSQCSPARDRVVPGDEGASYLVDKLLDRDLCFGTRMPKMGSIPAGDIQIVIDWIAEGALDN